MLQRLRSLVGNVFWSSAFLGSYGGSLVGIVTLLRRLQGRNSRAHPFIGAFLASWSIFLERKGRRADLGLYVANQGLWCLWRKAVMTGHITPMRHGEVALFAASLAVMSGCRASGAASNTTRDTSSPIAPSGINSGGMLSFLLGERQRPRSDTSAAVSDPAALLRPYLVALRGSIVGRTVRRLWATSRLDAIAKAVQARPLLHLWCRRFLLGWAIK